MTPPSTAHALREAPAAYAVPAFVDEIARASTRRLIELEREGVPVSLLKEFSARLGMPAERIYSMLGVSKSTAALKARSARPIIEGSGAYATIALGRLLATAQGIVADAETAEARDFDTAEWLGRWLETPQPALGGARPAELIGTPTGAEAVSRVLGALVSGAYQ